MATRPMRSLSLVLFALSLAAVNGCNESGVEPIAGPRPDDPVVCTSSQTTEVSCANETDDDCDGTIDCADSECGGTSCAEGGYVCMGGGCALQGVLPELPTLANVSATVRGSSVEIELDPFAGARDYRVYAFPDPSEVTAESDGYVGVRDATFRCAGNRMTVEASQRDDGPSVGSASFRTIIQDVDVEGFTRTAEESTLGHVFVTPGEGRAAVHSLSDPDAEADNSNWCYGMRWYESRAKRFTTSESEVQELVADGWRDNGIVFYVPTEAAGTVTIYSNGTDARHPLYWPEGGRESEAREGGEAVFQVLAAAAEGTEPLKRVFYSNACGRSHDELMAGEARFERAYRQGSQSPHFGLHWSGLTERTTLVIEALDSLCPFPGGYISSNRADQGTGMYENAQWYTVADARALSSDNSVYINGQGEMGNRPIPIARSFITLSPETPPELDWSYGFSTTDTLGTASNEECLADNDTDCGSSQWLRYSSGIIIAHNSVLEPYFGASEQLGELWVGIADLGAGTKFRLFAPERAEMSADSFLYVTMLVDSFTTGRRYPQIIIADSDIPYPVSQNMVTGNALIVQPFNDWPATLRLSVCDHHQWEVNSQCAMYPDARWVLDPEAPNEGQPIGILPVPDFYEATTGLDQSVHYEVYASTHRVYLFFDGRPYACMDLPSNGVPTGDVGVTFGDVLYHSGAETVHSEFIEEVDHGSSIRHFSNLGFRSGVPAPGWDEARLPCQPASWLEI